MEVEEETTSYPVEESTAAETTNEISTENTTIDKESETELTKLTCKSEDTAAVVTAEVGEREAEEVVHCRNTDSASTLSGGVEDSVVIESVEDQKDVDGDAVEEIDVRRVAATESELVCTIDGDGDGDAERSGGHLQEETDGGDAAGDGIPVIQKDENEGEDKEIVGRVLHVSEVTDRVKDEDDDTNVQLEGVEIDEENDAEDMQLENVDNIQGDESKEEQIVAEVLKEDELIADEEVADKDVKKEESLAKEETVDDDLENDEKGTRVDEEDKSVDTEMETEKSLDTGMENEEEADLADEEKVQEANEETVDGGSENDEKDTRVDEEEKSIDTEMETEKSLETEMENEEEASLADEEKVQEANEETVDGGSENDEEDTMVEDDEKSIDTEMENEEETNLADEEKAQEAEIETESSTKGAGGKRKRGGKVSKAAPKASAAPRKTIEEDVCFICFDGGDLVLCDRRNCPKAYHPSCVNRDEAFFKSKGRWNCGWHLCSVCEKKADYMCYTCTYSLCKACTKTSVILCVREKEKKGLCEACMEIVMLIEKGENQENVNSDDKNSWEHHLFKDYWIETKEKHNLTFDELEHAKNPWKGSGKHESLIAQTDSKDDNGSDSDIPPPLNKKTRKSKRNTKKQKSNKEDDSSSAGPGPENAEWVSKDLLEFVTHMRNGDSSVITQFEVQDLLLEYIKRNKLRDPNHKSQIRCDARLENLFGRPRVAHIEMLKLLESHFLNNKEDSQIDDVQGTVVDTDVSPGDDKDKKRKGRKKSDRRGPQSNREDYAAIDKHNISLIYLRRKLVEDLLDDMDKFHGIIVGTFVRIRISGAHQKQDIYRLVQVTGTSEATWYTLSKRTTGTMLEILNLDKTETISIDSISNQDFMEDECKRLRQSIKCGLIRRLTVGDVLDKAMELQAVRVNDWFETEVVRLNHLRDRASDLGRKKELRECVEKLNVLKTPEERARRLEEIPVIHDDPTMDPEYESEDDAESDHNKQEFYKRSDSFRFNRRGRDQFSPRGDYTSKDSWSGTPRASSGRSHDFPESRSGTPRGKNTEFQESWSGTPRSSSAKSHEFPESWSGTPRSSSKGYEFTNNDATPSSFKVHREHSRDPFTQQPIILDKPPSVASASIAAESAPKINETEKMWHYKDPSEKIQGPFSMVQLRKWSKNGYFPTGLKIWRKSDKEDDGILLTDALDGKFPIVDPRPLSQDGQRLTRDHNHGAQISSINPAPDSRHEPARLPSPTPNKVNVGWTAGQTGPLTGPGSPSPNNAHLIACGNKDGNLAAAIDSATNNVSGAVTAAPQNVGPGQLGQPVAPAPVDGNMQPQMVQAFGGQNPQGWAQNMQPNPAMNMAGLQPMMYNQWTGVPNMVQNVQNPVGNFIQVPQEQWAPQYPFPVTQPNMMQQPQPQPQPQPLQPNVNWAANPNMGWVGPNTGTPMNWPPMVQGQQVTGPIDPSWAMQAGWVPVPVPQPAVQGVMPNQNWVATPVQGPAVAGNGNPGWVGPGQPVTNQVAAPGAGWVAPNMNQVPPNMNSGWVSGPGNQGGQVPNQSWVPPAGNQGTPPPGNNNQNWGPRNRNGNWGRNENRNDNRGNHNNGPRRNRGGSGYGGNNRRNFNDRQESHHRDSRPSDRDDRKDRVESGDGGGRSSDQ